MNSTWTTGSALVLSHNIWVYFIEHQVLFRHFSIKTRRHGVKSQTITIEIQKYEKKYLLEIEEMQFEIEK